jgi:hypothetical protein
MHPIRENQRSKSKSMSMLVLLVVLGSVTQVLLVSLLLLSLLPAKVPFVVEGLGSYSSTSFQRQTQPNCHGGDRLGFHDRTTTARDRDRRYNNNNKKKNRSMGRWVVVVGAVPEDQENGILPVEGEGTEAQSKPHNTRSFRKSVKRLTKKIVSWSGSDNGINLNDNESAAITIPTTASAQTRAIIDEAFGPLEDSIKELEDSLLTARAALSKAKIQSCQAIEAIEAAMVTSGSRSGEQPSSSPNGVDENDSNNFYTNLDSLTFEDIDYESSEMAPPFLDQDSCLMTDAEPLVRVEKAPDNSRRIFAGIDILASTEDVWKVSDNSSSSEETEQNNSRKSNKGVMHFFLFLTFLLPCLFSFLFRATKQQQNTQTLSRFPSFSTIKGSDELPRAPKRHPQPRRERRPGSLRGRRLRVGRRR